MKKDHDDVWKLAVSAKTMNVQAQVPVVDATAG